MRTILIVDDNPDIRALVKRGLEMEGYEVFQAENGLEAQERLAEINRPCLVFLDLMMPVMDGRQFLNWKNQQSKYADVCVVVISAMTFDKKLLAGTVEVLKKPVDLDVLLEIAEKCCA